MSSVTTHILVERGPGYYNFNTRRSCYQCETGLAPKLPLFQSLLSIWRGYWQPYCFISPDLLGVQFISFFVPRSIRFTLTSQTLSSSLGAIFCSSIQTRHLAAWCFDRNQNLISSRMHAEIMADYGFSHGDDHNDCICNVVVTTEEPHCNVGYSNALGAGDATKEMMILSVQGP